MNGHRYPCMAAPVPSDTARRTFKKVRLCPAPTSRDRRLHLPYEEISLTGRLFQL